MSQCRQGATARMDVRIPPDVRDIIDRAAVMQGRTRTDFLISAALEKAERVISSQTQIQFSLRDQMMLAKAITGDDAVTPPPLVQAVKREYEASIVSR